MQIIDIKPTAPTCYTTAGEWIAPTCDSLCWWHLLFPQPPFLLCLLFFDALSHHVHVFLFVGVNSEAEMASHDETATPDQPAAFERPSQLSTPIFPTHTWIPYIVGSTCLLRPWEWQIKRIGSPKGMTRKHILFKAIFAWSDRIDQKRRWNPSKSHIENMPIAALSWNNRLMSRW